MIAGALAAAGRYRHALQLLSARELQQRFQGTLLGPAWLVVQPLFLMAVYTFVFGVLLKVRFRPDGDTLSFSLYLLAGLLPYQAFQEAALRGAAALSANRGLLERSAVPAALLPAVPATASLVTEGLALLLLIAGAFVLTGKLSASVWLLPVAMIARLLLSLAVAWSMAVLSVFLRDLGQVLGLMLTLLFFATPILYPAELVPAGYAWVYQVNPFHHLVSAYRGLILDGTWPLVTLPTLSLFAAAAAAFGLWLFQRLLDRAKDFV